MVYLGMVYYCFTNISFFFARWPDPSKRTLQKDPPKRGSKVTTGWVQNHAAIAHLQLDPSSDVPGLILRDHQWFGQRGIWVLNGCWYTYLPRMMMEWKSVGMMTFPIYRKIKAMFQTTNQVPDWIKLSSTPSVQKLLRDQTVKEWYLGHQKCARGFEQMPLLLCLGCQLWALGRAPWLGKTIWVCLKMVYILQIHPNSKFNGKMMIIQIYHDRSWYIQIFHWVKLNTLKCPNPKIPTSLSFPDIPAPEGGLCIIVGRQIILKRAGFRSRRLHPRGWCWATCFERTKNLRNHMHVLTLKQFQGEKRMNN